MIADADCSNVRSKAARTGSTRRQTGSGTSLHASVRMIMDIADAIIIPTTVAKISIGIDHSGRRTFIPNTLAGAQKHAELRVDWVSG